MTGGGRSERRLYTLIPERSAVLLSVGTSLGPVTFGALGLEGFIEAAVGDGEIDPKFAPTAHLEVQVARLTSGNSAYDGELRRQIDARRFPTAYVDLHHATPVDDAARTFLVDGEITLRGVTQPAGGGRSGRHEAGQADVDGLVPPFDEAIGIRHQGRAGR